MNFCCIAPPPKFTCGRRTCGVNDAIVGSTASTRLVQFLMGLHESYNNECSQILMLDPLPDIERVFFMVYAVEKQRVVQVEMDEVTSHMACQLSLKDNKKDWGKPVYKKKPFQDKRNMFCSNCRRPGHTQDTCFQLHGVPDWYKALTDKKKGTKHFVSNVDEQQQSAVGSAPATANMNKDLESKESLVFGVLFKKLYVLQHFVPSCSSSTLSTDVSYSTSFHCDSIMWHNRLGHASFQAIKHVPNVDISDITSDLPCDVCHRAKKTRLPFSEPRTYLEAVEYKEWREAMKAELDGLERKKTWRITPSPVGK
ncbi:UNVERIFIED_CONTAM: hypothetical protein Slati_0515800 [Sesamum latifolium]|uniref:GAG-pre-integrase domain-containing protein n=1 Tax=Sesamum latifolium TaxID=2727402 RepID=A0AAW2XYI3_9LAMI